VKRDPGDPWVEQRRAFHRALQRPGALFAKANEVGQEAGATVSEQLIDDRPVDLVELQQQNFFWRCH
jgi:hypothetical protein